MRGSACMWSGYVLLALIPPRDFLWDTGQCNVLYCTMAASALRKPMRFGNNRFVIYLSSVLSFVHYFLGRPHAVCTPRTPPLSTPSPSLLWRIYILSSLHDMNILQYFVVSPNECHRERVIRASDRDSDQTETSEIAFGRKSGPFIAFVSRRKSLSRDIPLKPNIDTVFSLITRCPRDTAGLCWCGNR